MFEAESASSGPESPERLGDGIFTCVVDNQPRLHLEALRWFACLTEVAGIDPNQLVVHVVGPTSSEVLGYLDPKG